MGQQNFFLNSFASHIVNRYFITWGNAFAFGLMNIPFEKDPFQIKLISMFIEVNCHSAALTGRSLTFSKTSRNSSLNGSIKPSVRKLSWISSHRILSVNFSQSLEFLWLKIVVLCRIVRSIVTVVLTLAIFLRSRWINRINHQYCC